MYKPRVKCKDTTIKEAELVSTLKNLEQGADNQRAETPHWESGL